MGAHHPAAYFAESILNPNAVIITEKGYTGPDGLSRMPEYNSSLTIAQLIDLVAYLKGLQEPPPRSPRYHKASPAPWPGTSTRQWRTARRRPDEAFADARTGGIGAVRARRIWSW